MENSLRVQSVANRKQNLLGTVAGQDENQKPCNMKSSKGLGDSKATRNALVQVVNQPAVVKQNYGPAKGDTFFDDKNNIDKQKQNIKQENKLPKQNKKQPQEPASSGIQPTFQSKFTIYCDEEPGNGATDDDSMSLVDECDEFCKSLPVSEHDDSEELPDDPTCSFESLEKSVAVFSDDSFFSCNQIESGDAGRMVPGENFKEYTWDVMSYLLHQEKKYRPEPDYMSRQPEVNTKMRNILVDWMVEVTSEYKLNDETLFLAVDYIDRFLSEMSIARSHFQLLGTASLFISSKYEEIYPPDINEFIYITDDTYTKEQVLKMETLILKVLNLHLSTPTISYFLQRYLISFRTSKIVNNLAGYLCHLVLLDAQIFFKFYPSEIALAAVILAAHNSAEEHLIDIDFLTRLLELSVKSSGLILKELQERVNECMQELLHLQTHASSHPQQAIYTKYSSERLQIVASLPPMARTPAFKMLQ